jgi:hypothetical protein
VAEKAELKSTIAKQTATTEKYGNWAQSWQSFLGGGLDEEELAQLRKSFGVDHMKLGGKGGCCKPKWTGRIEKPPACDEIDDEWRAACERTPLNRGGDNVARGGLAQGFQTLAGDLRGPNS